MKLTAARELLLFRLINLVALVGLLGVLTGSLDLQILVGEQPCPLCLLQRSGMIGLAIGPIMNLLWGMRPAHYAISILAAMTGGAASTRQILLHIATPGDPGYGPAVAGFHLYTWAFITFAVGAAGCAALLLFSSQFSLGDTGVLRQKGPMRIATLAVVMWTLVYLVIIAVTVLPECGLGMCPDDPASTGGIKAPVGVLGFLIFTLGSLAIGVLLDRLLPNDEETSATLE